LHIEFDKDKNYYVAKFAKATASYFGFITLVDENNRITIYYPFKGEWNIKIPLCIR
jgi:hypothetical protein